MIVIDCTLGIVNLILYQASYKLWWSRLVPIADETDADDEADYNGGGSGWEVMEELAEELVVGCQIGLKVILGL